LVEEGVYWCDYSEQDAYENYMKFSLDEFDYYEPPASEFPKEINREEKNKKILGIDNKEITLEKAALLFNKVGLLYCDII